MSDETDENEGPKLAPWVERAMRRYRDAGYECRMKTQAEAARDAAAMGPVKKAHDKLTAEERDKQVDAADRIYAREQVSKVEACAMVGISHDLYKRIKAARKKKNTKQS